MKKRWTNLKPRQLTTPFKASDSSKRKNPYLDSQTDIVRTPIPQTPIPGLSPKHPFSSSNPSTFGIPVPPPAPTPRDLSSSSSASDRPLAASRSSKRKNDPYLHPTGTVSTRIQRTPIPGLFPGHPS